MELAEQLRIVGIVFSVVVGIALIVIAFNVVAIRRILEAGQQGSETTDRPSTRP
jgi:hypothetical protein